VSSNDATQNRFVYLPICYFPQITFREAQLYSSTLITKCNAIIQDSLYVIKFQKCKILRFLKTKSWSIAIWAAFVKKNNFFPIFSFR
jgi:hypothetical protein